MPANYYLMKIDIARSTMILNKFPPTVYLQLAHTFLSTVDAITQRYDAESRQVEYAGDSVLAYFPDRSDAAVNVLYCAAACRSAALSISEVIPSLRQFLLVTRVVIHYGQLVIANIGPFGSPRRTVIGLPLHEMAHKEKKIGPGAGYGTIEYVRRLPREVRIRYLSRMTNNVGSWLTNPNSGLEGYSIKWRALGAALGLRLTLN